LSASNNTKLMSISITALAVALVAIIVTSYSLTNITVSNESYEDGKSIPQTREIWLFSQVDEHIDEDEFGIPPDQFSHDSIVVKKGDNVNQLRAKNIILLQLLTLTTLIMISMQVKRLQ